MKKTLTLTFQQSHQTMQSTSSKVITSLLQTTLSAMLTFQQLGTNTLMRKNLTKQESLLLSRLTNLKTISKSISISYQKSSNNQNNNKQYSGNQWQF